MFRQMGQWYVRVFPADAGLNRQMAAAIEQSKRVPRRRGAKPLVSLSPESGK
ncbi:hypothetical protein [Pseudoalteromonas piscicida]|uniref:hypothetical protein n=1 Tax=Pseudoalteromonas piscicida TaxID=43662 RepID=UPI003B8A6F13